MPDLCPAGQEEKSQDRLRATAAHVRGQHEQLAWHAVRPDPCRLEKDEVRDGASSEDVAERRRGRLDVQDGEGEADQREAVAEVRHDSAEPEEPELALLEHP